MTALTEVNLRRRISPGYAPVSAFAVRYRAGPCAYTTAVKWKGSAVGAFVRSAYDFARSGVLLFPVTSGQITASLIASRLARRLRDPQRIPEVGMAIAAIALLLLGLLPPHMGWVIALGFVTGLGLGSVMAINQVVVQTIAGRKRLGVATAMNSLARSTGGASGAALFGALIFAQFPGADGPSMLRHASTRDIDKVVHAFHNGFLAAAVVPRWAHMRRGRSRG